MAPNGSSQMVLVVEDEWLVRSLIADEFRSAGWQVIESNTAEEAIDLVRAGRPVDVIFTDIQLAGDLSGWDVVSRVVVSATTLRSSTRQAPH